MSPEQFALLLKRYQQGQLDQANWDELEKAIAGGDYDETLKDDIMRLLESRQGHSEWTPALKESAWNHISRSIKTPGTQAGLHWPEQTFHAPRWAISTAVAGWYACVAQRCFIH